ncbi:MAG: hypothetical protein DHS20C11_12070 [Lysobacteraceae bacterium]|nr:MAG: hypothetical protein DHS20C11_12070 [Xanthomonadaceae bacterium]
MQAPTTELSQLQRDLEQAERAGLAQSAALELRFANERLAGARLAIEQHEYEQALQLIEQANINIELAEERAAAADARATVTELKRRNDTLRRDLGLDEDRGQ